MTISNSVYNTSSVVPFEPANTQTKSREIKQEPAQKAETLEKSAAYKAAERPQDTVTISEEAYDAASASAYTSSAASESESASQMSADELTSLEQLYDVDHNNELSSEEEQAMEEALY